VAVTDLINKLLQGKTLISVRGALFSANLLTIAKKTGGVRPIAVGYVWRWLAGKAACGPVKAASTALLAPRQLGSAGASGGARPAGENLAPQPGAGQSIFCNAILAVMQMGECGAIRQT